jgi:hypothetical protein
MRRIPDSQKDSQPFSRNRTIRGGNKIIRRTGLFLPIHLNGLGRLETARRSPLERDPHHYDKDHQYEKARASQPATQKPFRFLSDTALPSRYFNARRGGISKLITPKSSPNNHFNAHDGKEYRSGARLKMLTQLVIFGIECPYF